MISDIKVGYNCNNNCLHCVISENKKVLRQGHQPIDLSTEECLELIHKAKINGATTVVLTGGEPTIRKDFHFLLESCHKIGCDVQIQTNGRKFADKAFCDKLIIGTDDCFCIALHGSNENVHDLITRRQGSFKETIQGIKNLTSKKYNIIAKIVISKYNMHHLYSIMLLLHKLNIGRCNFAFPHALGKSSKNIKKILPRYFDLITELESLLTKARQFNMHIEFEAIPFCIIPNYVENIGEIQYLKNEKIIFTPVRESTMDWTEVRKSIKRKPDSCNCCTLNLICEGPWEEYIENFGFEEFVPLEFNPEIITKLLTYIIMD